MTALLTLGNQPVVTCSVTIPRYGLATADVTMASALGVDPQVHLKLGKLDLKCAVYRAAPFAGVQSARLVGGYGGWRKTIKARGYDHEAGVRMSAIIGDAAREVGEKVNIVSDRAVGTHWTREKARAERTLHQLVANGWWVDAAGVTQIGATRSSAIITSPFTVMAWQGGRGRFEIATEALEDWMPGRTFVAPTVLGTQTINTVSISSDNAGKLRVVVLSESDRSENRLLDEIRAIIRAEFPSLTFSGFWQYKIDAVDGPLVDVSPLNPDGPVPPLTSVAPMPGLMGETVTQTVGNTVVVAFLDSNPAEPRWISADGDGLRVAINATLEVKIGAGTRPIIGAGDFAGPFPCVPTQAIGKI